MTREELEKKGYTVKENGKVDFSKPPQGCVFAPIQIEEEDIKLLGIDRRLVTRHRFSATMKTVVMVPVDQKEADNVKKYVNMVKNECKKAERESRCRIRSPKTGKEIWCPDCISCYSDECPKKHGMALEDAGSLSLDDDNLAETIRSCTYSSDPTADEAIANVMWEEFKEDLHRDSEELAYILEQNEVGYKRAEILSMLGRAEGEISWINRQFEKIKRRWRKYNRG